jgi:RNA polymerase sigma-70 factor (ECF subfamily)
MGVENRGDADIRLMLAVRAGDLDAFETLHNRHQDKVLRFFYGLTGAPHVASDLCQETFVRVWRIRKRYQATSSFAAYLFGVARVVWMEHRRKVARLWKWESPGGLDTLDAATLLTPPDEEAARRETAARIFAALEQLPEEQRIVFVMRTIDGLPLEDIATALDCPVNTVRSRKIFAVKRLRFLLQELYGDWVTSPSETKP